MGTGKTGNVTQELVDLIRSQFCLDWFGIHGAAHWARVRVNGLQLARTTGANVKVVELFLTREIFPTRKRISFLKTFSTALVRMAAS